MHQETNGHFEYLYDRTQKLTEALYRVTDLMTDHEPIKWFLRRQGLRIFEDLLEVKTSAPNERIKRLDLAADKIGQMVRTLGLASSGSFISEANFQTLSREYGALIEFILNQKTNLLPEPIGHSIGHLAKNTAGSVLEISDSEFGQEQEGVPSNRNNGSKGNNGEKGSNGNNGGRREKIISFIKEKDWVSVGELTELFRGQISEKTLQRDLSGMADEGLLLKEGEKRWRRYKAAI